MKSCEPRADNIDTSASPRLRFFCGSPKRVSVTADFHSPFCLPFPLHSPFLSRTRGPSSSYNNAVVGFFSLRPSSPANARRVSVCGCVVRGKGNINGSHLCVKNDSDISKTRSLIIGFALASGVVATPTRSFGACLPCENRFARATSRNPSFRNAWRNREALFKRYSDLFGSADSQRNR